MGIFNAYINETKYLSSDDIIAGLMEACNLMSEAYMDSEQESQYMFERYIVSSIEEGANTDMTEVVYQYVKNYRQDIKQLKSYLKNGQYKEAKKSCKDLQKILDEMEKKIRSIEGDAGSAVLGFFIEPICSLIQASIALFSAGYLFATKNSEEKDDDKKSTSGIIAGVFSAVFLGPPSSVIMDLASILKSMKELKTSKKSDALNLYRSNILTSISGLRKYLEKLEKAIDQSAKK